MQGEQHDGGFQNVATWLEQQEKRLQALEAENHELHRQLTESRRQLAELRRGVGIAIMIEGRMLAVTPAAATEETGASPEDSGRLQAIPGPAASMPDASFAQSQPGAIQRTLRTVAAGAKVPTSPPALRRERPMTAGPASQSTPSSASPHTGYTPREHAPEHHSFPPLASTPEHLPGTQPLPAPSSEWLRTGGAWPDASGARSNGAPTPTPAARPATNPPAARSAQNHPLWDQRDRPKGERNPFADSFIL